jgi:beta-glucosidase
MKTDARFQANAMTAPSAKKRVLALFCGCIAGVLLLGAVFAVSECDRNISSHFHRKFQRPRKAEDAITAIAKDPERHAQFLERSKQGDIDLVLLGDSITDRWPRVGEWSWLKLAPYKPANFGIEGDCTEDLLWRLEHGELDAISPKVVVVLIGSNNVFYFADETPEWTARGIEKIIAVIQKRSPASRVLLLGIFPRDEKDSRVRRTITAVNREIQRLDDGARVRFVDIGAQFLDSDGNIPANIMPDKVHLNAKGYAIWYRSLESILPEMLK